MPCDLPALPSRRRVPALLASFYSFVTFYGVTTGTIYRLDEGFIHHGICTRDVALAPAVAREHGAQNVIELPSLIFCPHCKSLDEDLSVENILLAYSRTKTSEYAHAAQA